MRRLKRLFRRVKKLFDLNYNMYVQYREHKRFSENLSNPAEYWFRMPQLLFERERPLFVLSTGRCGTALLTLILNRIPGAACYHEPFPELLYSEKKAYEEGLERFETYKTAIRTARFELLMDCLTRGRLYIETNYRITFFAPHLYELFPKSRFLHLVRDPAAFVRSGVRLGYYQGLSTDIGRITPTYGSALAEWDRMCPFERMAWLWNETNEYIERFKEQCEPERILTVRAEELFFDPMAAAKIIEFCGLPVPPVSRITKWIKRRVNVKESAVEVPPYDQWDHGLKEKVRRWARTADKYEYKL